MALAFLKFDRINGQAAEFVVDLGVNRFYKLKTGKSVINANGIQLVDEVDHETLLTEGEGASLYRSLFKVRIPITADDKGWKYVQLYSFRDKELTAPAVSKVVRVHSSELSADDQPLMFSALNVKDMPPYTGTLTDTSCRTVSFSFTEARLSTPMFWDALLQAARVLAPTVVNAIIGQGSTQPGSASPGQSSNNQQIINVVNAVIDALRQQPASGSAHTANTANPTPAAAPAVSGGRSLSFATSAYRRRMRTGRKVRLSTQKVVPIAAIAALAPALAPMLGPLLQQSPQLLQTVIDSPMRLFNVLGGIMQQQQQADLARRALETQHIQNVTSDAHRNFLLWQQILRSAANPPAAPAEAPAALSFSKAVARPKSKIVIQKRDPITVNGKPKHVYSSKENITLQAHLTIAEKTKKGTIDKVIITLTLKDPDKGTVLLEKNYRLKDVAPNALHDLLLLRDETAMLPLNKDIVVNVTAKYAVGAKTASAGADTHIVFLAGDRIFKGIGNKVAAAVPLTDRNKYRVFWNKIWEGSARDKKRWEIEVATKYYVYYRHDQATNGRVETKILQDEGVRQSGRELNIVGKMKSGLEVSPDALNELMPVISRFSALDQAQLAAFRTDEVSRDINSEAIATLKLKGKTEETGMIWAYPEIALFEFSISKITQVDNLGQVVKVEDEKIVFPKPVSIHFVGEKTKES